MPQKKLDSIQEVLYALDKKDTTQIVKLGLYIIKHTASDKQRYAIFQKVSESYFRTNEVDKSIAYLFKAKDVAEKIEDPELMAQAYGSIANQYSFMNLNDNARAYLDRAIEQIEKIPNGEKKYRLKGLSALELGKHDFNSAHYKAANGNYLQALREFKKIENLSEIDRYHYRRAVYNIGNSYYYLNEADSSEAYLHQALGIKDEYSPELKYYIYSTLSEVYAFRKNHQRAIDTLQVVLQSPNFNIPNLESEIYLNLSKNYKSLGDNNEYINYNEAYLELNERLKSEDLKAINKAFTEEHKGLVNSITKSKEKNQWLIYGIIGLVFVGFCGVIYFVKKKKEDQKKYQTVVSRLENQILISTQKDSDVDTDSKTINAISTATEADLLEKLKKFESSEKFRNPKITLSTMAVQLKTNPTYLSTVIKMHKDQNFNTYINELRINYICRKIHSYPKYLDYKISYLAEESGFISHSTFSTIFKNVTGISPSVFLREEVKQQGKKT
ncbi:helix-turn-helix domain-containing protein [Winogradskyella psychrotolerans]|uniref:helix-turn-helix domain-containing protein n=1 Tax=Winogradskyella psychrotolerans TaxID=1344585 RepID=UPI001C0691F8|nr:AraC family transcriptional regulator [Winogradskyella psychrotolerans]MBU2926685.1 AraC family transcriptional regulator [Winogradskyella psychrotolerans]